MYIMPNIDASTAALAGNDGARLSGRGAWRTDRPADPSQGEIFAKLIRGQATPDSAPSVAVPVPSTPKPEREQTAAEKTSTSVFSDRPLNSNPDAADVTPVEGGDFELADMLDVLNPLQHFPIIGSVYRNFSGDTLSGSSRAMGGMVYGGPAGLLMGIGSAIFAQEHKGQDAGELILSRFQDQEAAPEEQETASDTDADSNSELLTQNPDDDAEQAAQNLAALPDHVDDTPLIDAPAVTPPAPAIVDNGADIPAKPPQAAIPVQAEPLANKPFSPSALRAPYDLGPVTPAPNAAMPELMQRGLDKYEALIKERMAK